MVEIKIKIVSGIPCIVLAEGVIEFKNKIKKEPKREFKSENKNFSVTWNFTDIQQLKEKNSMKEVLEDLKKTVKSKHKIPCNKLSVDFTFLQRKKEFENLRDVLKELKKRFEK